MNSSLHLVAITLDIITQRVIVRRMSYLLHTGFMTDMYVILTLFSFHLFLLYVCGMQSAMVELAQVCTIYIVCFPGILWLDFD